MWGEPDMKVFFLSRRWLALLGGLAACAAIFCAAALPGAITTAAAARQLPIHGVKREQRAVALTFNVLPEEETGALVDLLARYDTAATFFVDGGWADLHPEAVLALHQAGHEVMNHSDALPRYNQLTAEEILEDLTRCGDKLEAITGQRPALARCPYGAYDDHVIAAIRSAGLEPIQWSVDSGDRTASSADEICERVAAETEPGAILLFHNAGPCTLEALPTVLEFLLSDGYQVLPVSQLLLQGDCVVDSSGWQQAA